MCLLLNFCQCDFLSVMDCTVRVTYFWNLDEEEQQGKLPDNVIHCTIRKQDQQEKAALMTR